MVDLLIGSGLAFLQKNPLNLAEWYGQKDFVSRRFGLTYPAS